MPIAHAMWTHGHSMHIEFPDRVASFRRAGFYIEVVGKAGFDNWFHFAVPTPLIVNDQRLKADSVLIRFRCHSNDTSVRAVHVYDGEGKIAEHDNLGLNPVAWHVARLSVPRRPQIFWGLGISVNVACGVENLNHQIDFAAAGCDFWL